LTVYIGNLPFQITEEDIKSIFSKFGAVKTISMPVDKETGRIRGFSFVDLDDESQELQIISELDGAELMGRILKVSQAKPSVQKPRTVSSVKRGFGGVFETSTPAQQG